MNSFRTRVKMCGMTRVEDVIHSVALGVDALGFIFSNTSPRQLTLEQARELMYHLPPFVSTVAVLVNPSIQFVRQIITELPIQFLQFHGEESPEFCQQFDIPFIKAIPALTKEFVLEQMNLYSGACALLLDTPSAKSKGGTGMTFDWTRIPENSPVPYILAGGLNPINVLEAAFQSRAYAVDVCSGIEVLPGIKDHLKMTKFMQALGGMNEQKSTS